MDTVAPQYGFTEVASPATRAALPGSMSRLQEKRAWQFCRSTAAGRSGKFFPVGWSDAPLSTLRCLVLTLGVAFSPAGLPAQQSTHVIDTLQAAGPQYGAGGLHRLFLGREYRSLWTTPISVEVL